jgi:hypothetical protein
MGKMTLVRLSENARFFIIHLLCAFTACGRRPPRPDSSKSGELASMWRQVVDALMIIDHLSCSCSPANHAVTTFLFDLFVSTGFRPNSASGRVIMDIMRNVIAF